MIESPKDNRHIKKSEIRHRRPAPFSLYRKFCHQKNCQAFGWENLKASHGSGIFQRWREERGSERTRERWGEGNKIRGRTSEGRDQKEGKDLKSEIKEQKSGPRHVATHGRASSHRKKKRSEVRSQRSEVAGLRPEEFRRRKMSTERGRR